MTEVCFDISQLHFTAACRQQQQAADAKPQQGQVQLAQGFGRVAPPRCAVQNGETFIPAGTTAAAVVQLLQRQPE